MASQTTKRTTKRRNGVGDSLTVLFDKHDSSERRALQASRLLAAKHGRRKQVVIALLEAVYAHYEATGELLSSAEITAALMGQPVLPTHAPVGFIPPQTAQTVASDASAEQRRAGRLYADDEPTVVIAESCGKASAQTVADNFIRSMGAAFFD